MGLMFIIARMVHVLGLVIILHWPVNIHLKICTPSHVLMANAQMLHVFVGVEGVPEKSKCDV